MLCAFSKGAGARCRMRQRPNARIRLTQGAKAMAPAVVRLFLAWAEGEAQGGSFATRGRDFQKAPDNDTDLVRRDTAQ